MILFFDRSMGKTIPEILRQRRLRFPLKVEYHQLWFAPEEHDDVWLAQVGLRGWTVIGQDYNYHNKPHELAAIKQYGIGCFYLWGAEAKNWDTLTCFVKGFERIRLTADVTPRPFIFHVGKDGRLKPQALP